MNKSIAIRALACCAVVGTVVGTSMVVALATQAPQFQAARDPIATPAASSASGVHSAMTAVASAGNGDKARLVAVGRRGVILASDDAGANWRQMPSPVSGDLTAVRFQDALHGWIVGHDAVVLKTVDGGLHWERKLDGRAALALLSAAYGAQGSTPDAAIAQDIERAGTQSATPGVLPYPLLDVWFASADDGYVVGAFGLILHTRDGGASWTPMVERTANSRMNHIYAVGGVAGQGSVPAQIYLAGEQGFLRRLDPASGAFVAMTSPYEGSYFGLYADAHRLVLHGLRGNAYVRDDRGGDGGGDGGAQWRKIATGSAANIVAALPGPGGAVLLVSQAGEVLSTAADGATAPVNDQRGDKAPRGGEVYGAALSRGALVVTGITGARVLRTISTH